MSKNHRHHHAKDRLQQDRQSPVFLRAKAIIDQFSPFGFDHESFIYNRDCVRLDVRDGSIAEPQDEDGWVAAIVREHRTNLKSVGNINFYFHHG